MSALAWVIWLNDWTVGKPGECFVGCSVGDRKFSGEYREVGLSVFRAHARVSGWPRQAAGCKPD